MKKGKISGSGLPKRGTIKLFKEFFQKTAVIAVFLLIYRN